MKADKKRASYYNYYTSKRWGDLNSYNLCVDSGLFGVDGAVEIIKRAVEERERSGKKKIYVNPVGQGHDLPD